MIAYLIYLRGLLRLKGGFCPFCWSSPPEPDCPVCRGSYEYGYRLAPGMKFVWETRWKQAFKNRKSR